VDKELVKDWKNAGMKKIVLKISSTEEMLELFQKAKRELPCALITDAGHTQIEPGSKTCFACGPVEENEGQKYFAKLKLL
jgi:PTH2 family peptidyl-tRNA hydrolase